MSSFSHFYQPCLVLKFLYLNNVCASFAVRRAGISDPVFLTSHLFTSSVHGTEHLVRSIVDFETFELDSHFACVSFNKQCHRQQLGATFDEELDQLLTFLILCSNRPFCRLSTVIFLHGYLLCLWLEVSLIYQYRT